MVCYSTSHSALLVGSSSGLGTRDSPTPFGVSFTICMGHTPVPYLPTFHAISPSSLLLYEMAPLSCCCSIGMPMPMFGGNHANLSYRLQSVSLSMHVTRFYSRLISFPYSLLSSTWVLAWSLGSCMVSHLVVPHWYQLPMFGPSDTGNSFTTSILQPPPLLPSDCVG